MMIRILSLLPLLAASFLGCATLYENSIGLFEAGKSSMNPNPRAASSPATFAKDAHVSIEPLLGGTKPEAPASTRMALEWSIADDSVDGFVIYYGPTREAEHSLKVSKDEIEKEKGTAGNTLYRYTLQEVPANQQFYVAISAYRGHDISAPSETLEVAPLIEMN